LSGGLSEAIVQIRERQVSPVEMVRACLDRIDRFNDRLNAYLTITAESAMAQAQAAEAVVMRGGGLPPLLGIPVALKDNIAVAGVRMTAGSKFLRYNVAGEDANVTARLKLAGAISLGKLNMHEWAFGATSRNPHYGAVRNPWDTSRSPGGSSGGSGVAIAADMALGTLGTDTGGSVRIPGSLCGVCALRPTTGRVSNRGVVPLSWTLDTVGPLAWNVEDIAHLLSVIAGYDSGDPTTVDLPVGDYLTGLRRGVHGLRFGLLGGYFERTSSSETYEPVRIAAQVFEELGASVDVLELPETESTVGWTSEMIAVEAAAVHKERLEARPEDFGLDVLTRLRFGAEISGPRHALARKAQRDWQRELHEVFADYHVLLAPTCSIPAPDIEASQGVETTRLLTRLCYPFSLAGVPALNIPIGFTTSGLPVGMQLVASKWKEDVLLRAAWSYQQSTHWHERRPILEG
jgi:aspartyl-tRNA(Asn)/glutamyl-tRNA(Gln) amidotransferase subunit A